MLQIRRFSILARELTFPRLSPHHLVTEYVLRLQLSRASGMPHKMTLPLSIGPSSAVDEWLLIRQKPQSLLRPRALRMPVQSRLACWSILISQHNS
jgi:hypothetical protein